MNAQLVNPAAHVATLAAPAAALPALARSLAFAAEGGTPFPGRPWSPGTDGRRLRRGGPEGRLAKLRRALVHALAYDATFRALAPLGGRRLAAPGLAGADVFQVAEAAARRAVDDLSER